MSIISRHYEPAPAPPPPDEGYWAALLGQADKELEEALATQEEVDWGDLDQFQSPASSHQHGVDHDWTQAIFALDNDQTIDLKVVGYNRGGILVEWNTLRGFVPASQLIDVIEGKLNLHGMSGGLAVYVGRTLPVRVIELNRAQNRLILSERAAQVSPGKRAEVLHTLSPDTRVRGIVTNICDFGAFVDLGGVEGLIHISELSWGRVEHPSEVLTRGQEVTVYIMDVDREEGRIALSIKRMQPDPWATVEQRYQVGQEIEGFITSVVDFGAFACLEEGLEGLIHISELAEGHFLHPRNVVQEGDQVVVKILNIDSHARRIGLSLRAVKRNG